jgi:C_GCAxxG_C_C family probable redox protein
MTKKEKVIGVFHNDLNCAQSVLSVYGNEYGIDEKSAKAIAVGFGSGIGKTQQICGALTGAVMVLGAKYFDEDNAAESKEKVYTKTRELLDSFREKNGDCNCRNLLGIDISTEEGQKLAHEKDVFNLKCKKYLSDVCDNLDKLLK